MSQFLEYLAFSAVIALNSVFYIIGYFVIKSNIYNYGGRIEITDNVEIAIGIASIVFGIFLSLFIVGLLGIL